MPSVVKQVDDDDALFCNHRIYTIDYSCHHHRDDTMRHIYIIMLSCYYIAAAHIYQHAAPSYIVICQGGAGGPAVDLPSG